MTLDRIRTRAERRRRGAYLGEVLGKGRCFATHDGVIDNASGAAVRSDLNSALAALFTQHSGTSWATTYARQRVADTSAGVIKRRNAANSGWIDVETDDESFVINRSSNTIWDRSDRGKVYRVTGSYTQTIDAAATVGDGWSVAVRVESGATLTIDPNSTEQIDGATTKDIVGPASGRVHCNGTAFYTEGFISAATLTTTAPRLLENIGLTVSMAGNAVTVALKGADGNDPSASNLVGIGFRNSTVTNGQSSKVQVSAATSVTVSSGSTLGTVSGEASRVWIAAINNAGAVELAVFQTRSGTSIAPINEGGLISTTAEGGAGAADSAQTWYSTSARTNVPVTVLGYFDSTQATAGTWASSPASVVVNPRYRPNDVVQVARTDTGSMATGTTTIPLDNTIPQNTEGDQYMTQAITPVSAANILHIEALFQGQNGGAGRLAVALFQDSTANALKTGLTGFAQNFSSGEVVHRMLAATTSSTTFKVRAGSNNAGTTTFNGEGGAAYYNGTANSFLQVEEIVS